MKKTFLSYLIWLIVPISYCTAQNMSEFVRLSVGVFDMNANQCVGAKAEYGLTYRKWIEGSLSLGLYNSLPLKSASNMILRNSDNPGTALYDEIPKDVSGKISFSGKLNIALDPIKYFFPSSRHGFKVGGGIGVCQYHRIEEYFTDQAWKMDHQMTFGLAYSIRVAYEYDVSDKVSIGLFGEVLPEPEVAPFGVLVKRTF